MIFCQSLSNNYLKTGKSVNESKHKKKPNLYCFFIYCRDIFNPFILNIWTILHKLHGMFVIFFRPIVRIDCPLSLYGKELRYSGGGGGFAIYIM